MSAERAPAPVARRLHHRLAPLAVLAVVVITAACTSGTSGTSGSTSPTPSQPLAPWVGTFIGVTVPAGVHSLQDVTCPTASRCWAVGSTLASAKDPSIAAVVASGNGGRSWVVQVVPAGVTYLTDIACTGVHTCIAVGQAGTAGDGPGAVISTTNGGVTWTLQTVPAGTSDVTAVACTAGGRCTALADIAGRVTTLTPAGAGAGGAWVAGGALPATVSAATAESCTDAAHCWATGISPVDVGHAVGAVAATADSGATWALQTVPSGTGALQGISCTQLAGSGSSTTTSPPTSTVACTAVGTTATSFGGNRTGQGIVLTTSNGGTAWVSAVVTSTSADLLAVSCGAGPCVAVGTTVASAPQAGIIVLARSGAVGAGAWRRAISSTVALPLAGVSCLSLASCVVVGNSITAHLSAR